MKEKYNLYEIVEIISNIAIAHPEVNTVFTNQYDLLSKSDINYGAILITENPHQIGDRFSIYSFNLLYADQIIDNNEEQIKSIGMDILVEIINTLRKAHNCRIGDYSITTFYQNPKFSDMCAGCFTTIELTVRSNLSTCSYYCYEPKC